MSAIGIALGLQPAAIPAGRGQEYIDGRPKIEQRWHRADDGSTRGERARRQIMALVDEWGEVDMAFLLTDDNIGLSRKALQMHLACLVDAGKLERHDPEQPGAGKPATWKKAMAATR